MYVVHSGVGPFIRTPGFCGHFCDEIFPATSDCDHITGDRVESYGFLGNVLGVKQQTMKQLQKHGKQNRASSD